MVTAGRELEAVAFGQFAIIMATVALLLILHAGIFSEPMLVYGPRDYIQELQQYLSRLAYGQFVFATFMATATILASLFWLEIEVALLVAPVIVLGLSMDFQERSFFMQLRPHLPLVSASLQFATLVFLIFAWPSKDVLGISDLLRFYIMSLAFANIVLFIFHRAAWSKLGSGGGESTCNLAKRHLSFAARTLAAHFLLFAMTNAYIFVLPLLQDLEATANFRAQLVVAGPGVQALSALGLIAIPVLSVSTQKSEFISRLVGLLIVISLIGVPLIFIAGIWGDQILIFVFDGQYGLTPLGYWLAGLYPLTIGYAFMLGSALRAIDRAGLVARCSAVAAIVSLPVGLWLTYRFGEEGVILAQIIGSSATAGLCALALTNILKQIDEWE